MRSRQQQYKISFRTLLRYITTGNNSNTPTMAASGEIVTRPSFSSFKFFSRKSLLSRRSASSIDILQKSSDCHRKSNLALPGFKNNLNEPNYVVVKNDFSPSPISRHSSIEFAGDSISVVGSTSKFTFRMVGNSSGPKFKLIHEADVQVCRLNHPRTVLSKILGSKFLRRWETHHLFLTPTQISSKTPSGYMEEAVQYTSIDDIYAFQSCDSAAYKNCVCIDLPEGILLLQVNNAYVRDQWLLSITWKKTMLKYKKLLSNTRRSDVFIKELKSLVEMTMTTPLQDDCIYNSPLELISELLQESLIWLPKSLNEEIISVISPLLEMTTPTAELCEFLSQLCRENPRSLMVIEMFTPIVLRILKRNMDFGKFPKARMFIQEYIQALSYQNDGRSVLGKFLNSCHGVSSTCPHPRVLPNLVSVCLAAVYSLYEEKRNWSDEDRNVMCVLNGDWESRLLSFISLLDMISAHEDWLVGLSQLLQPIPFPEDALADSLFTKSLKTVVERMGQDERCEVHLCVLGIREEKDGWMEIYSPGSVACDDDGNLWSEMLRTLLSCCCRRKSFLERTLLKRGIGWCMLRALRGDETCQSALCHLIELEVVEKEDTCMQIKTTLESTEEGRKKYAELSARMDNLKALQMRGGPRKLTLPVRSTDADLERLLGNGSFGNLEVLSLAFTLVTNACAEKLIRLKSLKYLNLWSTQFGDLGLQKIAEHLPRLQVLNLCETPVTDKGLLCLSNMKSLRKLNLNSTKLSAHTFEKLKQELPALQECDIRYTDAW